MYQYSGILTADIGDQIGLFKVVTPPREGNIDSPKMKIKNVKFHPLNTGDWSIYVNTELTYYQGTIEKTDFIGFEVMLSQLSPQQQQDIDDLAQMANTMLYEQALGATLIT